VEATEIYKKRREEIDIVIIDMIMPNMGDGETFDRLKAISPDVKVVLSSGCSIDGEASEIIARRCSGFIQKPFHPDALSKKLSEFLGYNIICKQPLSSMLFGSNTMP